MLVFLTRVFLVSGFCMDRPVWH